MKNTIYTAAISLFLLLSKAVSASDWENYSNYSAVTDAVIANNQLWITAKGGIVKIDQATGQKRFIHKGELGLMSASVEKVVQNMLTGDVWIGTYDNGLAKWNGSSFQSFPFPSPMLLLNMKFNTDGMLWMESDNGLFKFNPSNGVYTKVNDAPSNPWSYNAWGYDFTKNNKVIVFDGFKNLILNPVTNAVEDSFGLPIDTTTLLPGEFGLTIIFQGCAPTNVSVFTLDSNTCLLQNSSQIVLYEKSGILRPASNGLQSGEQVQNIVRGDDGVITLYSMFGNIYKWTGGQWLLYANVPVSEKADKLLYYTGSKNLFSIYDFTGVASSLLSFSPNGSTIVGIKQQPFKTNAIRSVAKNDAGQIFAAAGNEIYRYNESGNNWTLYCTAPSLYGQLSSLRFIKGDLYFIDYGNMMYKYDGTTFTHIPFLTGSNHKDVYEYDVAPDGTIWIVAADGLLKYDGTTTTKVISRTVSQPFLCVKYDALNDLLWIGSTKGIYQYDFTNTTIIDQTTVPAMANGESIQTIEIDASNNVWFGANNKQVIKFDGSNYSVLLTPGVNNGEFITDIVFYKDIVYFDQTGGDGGIYKYDGTTWTLLNTATQSKLISSSNYDITVDNDGHLWVAHQDAGVSVQHTANTSAIHEAKAASFSFYPNPANDFIQVGNNFDGTAVFFDMQGKRIAEEKAEHGRIHVQSLPAGVYVIEVLSREGRQRAKLIKE